MRHLKSRLRPWKCKKIIYRYYWWIALALFVISFIVVKFYCGSEKSDYFIGITGALLGFCYFVQQQKLAETTFFNQLFTQFNKRYDKLNGKLAKLCKSDLSKNDLSQYPKQRDLIVDYFNLCAEEYLFYKQGYILEDVWQSWCRGMKCYLDKQLFKEVWDEEIQQTDSFYGLKIPIIEEAAERQ